MQRFCRLEPRRLKTQFRIGRRADKAGESLPAFLMIPKGSLRGEKQKGKTKGKKSNPVNQKDSQCSNLALHKWKSFELIIFGCRIKECADALCNYTKVPKAYETINLSSTNFADAWKTNLKHLAGVYPDPDKLRFPMVDPELSLLIAVFEKSCASLKERFVIELNQTTIKKVFDYIAELLRELDINKQESLGLLMESCADLCACGSDYDMMKDNEKDRFMLLEHVLRSNACEALGYWTAKLEEMNRNKKISAKVMEDKGKKNKEAIKKVIEDLGITSLKVFRKDKKLRGHFYETALKKTIDRKYNASLSEKRIADIAREILKEKNKN